MNKIDETETVAGSGIDNFTPENVKNRLEERKAKNQLQEADNDWSEERWKDEMFGSGDICESCGEELDLDGNCVFCNPDIYDDIDPHAEETASQQATWKAAGLDDDSLDDMGNIVGAEVEDDDDYVSEDFDSLEDIDEFDDDDDMYDDETGIHKWDDQSWAQWHDENREEDDDDWDDLEESVQSRLELRRQLNESYDNAIESNKLQEALDDEESDINQLRYKTQNLVRYQPQEFLTDNPRGTPEEFAGYNYEAERMERNRKNRKTRYEQDNADRELNDKMGVQRTSKMPAHMLDGQEDEFLYQWMKDKKASMALQESKNNLNKKIDNFLKNL